MDKWRVVPSSLSGTIRIPPSKSHTIRALVFALLAKGKSVIYAPLFSSDAEAMIRACHLLGGKVEVFEKRIEMIGIDGKLAGARDVICAGNSGLVLRLLGAIAGLSTKAIVITGDCSVRERRPVSPLIDALSQLGARAFSMPPKGGAPIFVQGPLYPGMVVMEGADSQPVSGMLIACAFAPGPVEISVLNAGERPWVHLTLRWLEKLGIPFLASPDDYYRLEGGSSIEGFCYTVPGDFSSAAFPLVASLITGSEIVIENLDFSDSQGDKKLITILQQMGASFEIDRGAKRLYVRKATSLRGLTIDVNDIIDAIPILAVLGCFAEGQTRLLGASIARKKECDRLACTAKELSKMGGDVQQRDDELLIRPSLLKGAYLDSHRDHRLAMALTVAALKAKGESVIQQTGCVAKSYPLFMDEIKQLGADIQRC